MGAYYLLQRKTEMGLKISEKKIEFVNSAKGSLP